MTALIPLRCGDTFLEYAIVDECDAHLAEHAWRRTNGYATRICPGNRNPVYMHREILGLAKGDGYMVVDHINRDRLDNRRSNLRLVTVAENCRNRGKDRVVVPERVVQ